MQRLRLTHLALPNDQRIPTLLGTAAEVTGIARPVPVELCLPEIAARFWDMGKLAALMLVPEASMDEDGFPTPWECHIGAARRRLPLQAEAIAEAMQRAAHDHLGLGVGPPDASHVGASVSRGKPVGHDGQAAAAGLSDPRQ